MTYSIDHTELMTLLENNLNINNAILKVAEISGSGDVLAVVKAVYRSHELILQSIKSTTAIIHQVQERNCE